MSGHRAVAPPSSQYSSPDAQRDKWRMIIIARRHDGRSAKPCSGTFRQYTCKYDVTHQFITIATLPQEGLAATIASTKIGEDRTVVYE